MRYLKALLLAAIFLGITACTSLGSRPQGQKNADESTTSTFNVPVDRHPAGDDWYYECLFDQDNANVSLGEFHWHMIANQSLSQIAESGARLSLVGYCTKKDNSMFSSPYCLKSVGRSNAPVPCNATTLGKFLKGKF